MKFSNTYRLYKIKKVLKAIGQFFKDWWYVIGLGFAIYLLTKIDEIL